VFNLPSVKPKHSFEIRFVGILPAIDAMIKNIPVIWKVLNEIIKENEKSKNKDKMALVQKATSFRSKIFDPGFFVFIHFMGDILKDMNVIQSTIGADNICGLESYEIASSGLEVVIPSFFFVVCFFLFHPLTPPPLFKVTTTPKQYFREAMETIYSIAKKQIERWR